jgi:hypothetical protein
LAGVKATLIASVVFGKEEGGHQCLSFVKTFGAPGEKIATSCD